MQAELKEEFLKIWSEAEDLQEFGYLSKTHCDGISYSSGFILDVLSCHVFFKFCAAKSVQRRQSPTCRPSLIIFETAAMEH